MTFDKLIVMNKLMLVPATRTEVTAFYSRIEKKSEFIYLIQGNKGFTAFQERTKPMKLTIGGELIINIVQWQMALLLSLERLN